MSDEQDKESKTEKPTEKRRQDAFEKGNKPFSAEVVTMGSFWLLFMAMHFMATGVFSDIANVLSSYLARVGEMSLSNGADGLGILHVVFLSVGGTILPFLLLLTLGGLLGSLLQNPPGVASERVAPKLSRLSPKANFSRMIGRDGLTQLLVMVIKAVIVAAVTLYVLKGILVPVLNASLGDVTGVPWLIWSAFQSILLPLCLLALLLAMADLVKVRFKWLQDLMMSQHEIKQEHKQAEGDPHIKQRFRAIGRQRATNRMMRDVPRATVVVVNPTHYAVAMRYVPSEGGAPVVLAKGVDFLALRIRETCEELGIPLVEDKPLAQSLYKSVEVGQMIPADFYRAVAEVINFVEMRRRLAAR
jgi:flagellar biosynthesis protein FlhB